MAPAKGTNNIPMILIWIAVVGAQDFNPTISSLCRNGFLSVTVTTSRPFNGVVYPEGRIKECRTNADGKTRTEMHISLTDLDRCALNYNHEREEYFVLLNVREHPVIILQQDKMFNVSCRNRNNIALSDSRLADETPVRLGVFSEDGQRKMHETVFGGAYHLRIAAPYSERRFHVTACYGFAGEQHNIQLTDDNGCSRNMDIMSNFVYNNGLRIATADLHSMFRFPNQESLHIQCGVAFCRGECLQVDCNRRRDDPFPDSESATESQSLTAQRFASTTVRVKDVGNHTVVVEQQDCYYENQVLYSLCALFGFLFISALAVNVIFCCVTGYCCCNAVDANDKGSDDDMLRIEKNALQSVMRIGPATLASSAPDCSSREPHQLDSGLLHYPPALTYQSQSTHRTSMNLDAIAEEDPYRTRSNSCDSTVKVSRNLQAAHITGNRSKRADSCSTVESPDSSVADRTLTGKEVTAARQSAQWSPSGSSSGGMSNDSGGALIKSSKRKSNLKHPSDIGSAQRATIYENQSIAVDNNFSVRRRAPESYHRPTINTNPPGRQKKVTIAPPLLHATPHPVIPL